MKHTTKKAKIGETHCCEMRRHVKVSVCQTIVPKIVVRTCFASRRREIGLSINEETSLLSPGQWNFEVDRTESRVASNIDMDGAKSAGEVLEEEHCIFREVCPID